MSIEVLKSATVSSQKIQGMGFHFKFPTLRAALKNIL
jgi:NAD dependent epimerase/dehydratase family enzyme